MNMHLSTEQLQHKPARAQSRPLDEFQLLAPSENITLHAPRVFNAWMSRSREGDMLKSTGGTSVPSPVSKSVYLSALQLDGLAQLSGTADLSDSSIYIEGDPGSRTFLDRSNTNAAPRQVNHAALIGKRVTTTS